MSYLEVDFIQDFIRDTVQGLKSAEIKTLYYRDGGVEISPGNIVKCIIPEWLKDQTIEINLSGGIGTRKSDFGEVEINASCDPNVHQVSGSLGSGTLQDNDSSHKITITYKGKLKDGDKVVVGKFSGIAKYIILAKLESEDA